MCVCVSLSAELSLLPVPLLVLRCKLGPCLPRLISWPEASGFHPEVYLLLSMNQHLFLTVCIPPLNSSMEIHPPKPSFPLLELVTLSLINQYLWDSASSEKLLTSHTTLGEGAGGSQSRRQVRGSLLLVLCPPQLPLSAGDTICFASTALSDSTACT